MFKGWYQIGIEDAKAGKPFNAPKHYFSMCEYLRGYSYGLNIDPWQD